MVGANIREENMRERVRGISDGEGRNETYEGSVGVTTDIQVLS